MTLFDENDEKHKCCCVHSYLGSKILAWAKNRTRCFMIILQLVAVLIGGITMTFNVDTVNIIGDKMDRMFEAINNGNLTSSQYKLLNNAEEYHEMLGTIGGWVIDHLVGAFVILTIFALLILSSLLVGLHKETRWLMLPHMFMDVFATIIMIPSIVGFAVNIALWIMIYRSFRYLGEKTKFAKQYGYTQASEEPVEPAAAYQHPPYAPEPPPDYKH